MSLNFNVLTFNDVAHFLIKNNSKDDQAFIRTAIGRIYYATYLKIRAKAKMKGFTEVDYPGAGGVHKKLMAFLDMMSDKNAFLISRDLKLLMKLRHNADYETHEVTNNDFIAAKGLFDNIKLNAQNSHWNF